MPCFTLRSFLFHYFKVALRLEAESDKERAFDSQVAASEAATHLEVLMRKSERNTQFTKGQIGAREVGALAIGNRRQWV